MPVRMFYPSRPSSGVYSSVPVPERDLLGDLVYSRVERLQPVLAGRITGMLLELDSPVLLRILEDEDAFKCRVEDAVQVLKVHNESWE